MKNKLTRKLMLSAFTLLFAVISLGASTYAWFVLSKDAQVKAFTGTVQAGASGLEIQVTAIDGTPVDSKWRSTELDLTKDFIDATTVKFTALQNNNGGTKFDAAKFAGYDADTKAEANKNYVAFRLYFRLADTTGLKETDPAQTVYLTDYDLTTVGTPNKWYVNKEYQGVKSPVTVAQDNVLYYVSDAARIAFVPKSTTIDPVIYETEALAGEENFASFGNDNKEIGANSYYNNVNENDLKYPDAYYTPQHWTNSTQAIGELSLNANETYVDVYVWIEGWDHECINAIFNQTLQILLKFSLNNKAQEQESTSTQTPVNPEPGDETTEG